MIFTENLIRHLAYAKIKLPNESKIGRETAESFSFIVSHSKRFKSPLSPKPNIVARVIGFSNPYFKNHNPPLLDKVAIFRKVKGHEENLMNDKQVYLSSSEFKNLEWQYIRGKNDMSSKDPRFKHHRLVVHFEFKPKPPLTIKGYPLENSILITYNDPPKIIDNGQKSRFKDVHVTDKNDDHIWAYEIKLVNKQDVGKVDVQIDDRTYPILKRHGLVFTPSDLAHVKFIKIGDSKSNSVKVSIRACDKWAWSDRATVSASLANK